MMRINDKGFTLLEAIIAFALLGIVSLMLIGFINAGSNSYRRVSSEVNLQFENQITMSQLREYFIDCNGGICTEGDRVYVINKTAADQVDVNVFALTDEKLMYGRKEGLDDDDDPPEAEHIMADYVTHFEVRPITGTDKVITVDIYLTTENNGKSYAAKQTVAPRNDVIKYDDYAGAVAALLAEE
ncbi:MAG: prepilin-type N-terminal cleavage/methylation domain-containing protein [Syntrophomonadaceae bacterium]|nr:prepilin-type N-terminal cleavage/methylation domain-containing protein [Syntrophomonadaceae bacterium]